MKFGRIGSDKNNKKEAQKRERQLASELGGKATPNSGSLADQPGDVVLENHLIDDKFTNKKQYTIELTTINKLCREANQVERIPVLIIQFRSGMSKLYPTEWALVPQNTTEIQPLKKYEISAKSKLVSTQMLNTLYKSSLIEEKAAAISIKFYGVAIGAVSDWILTTKDYLKKENYFE